MIVTKNNFSSVKEIIWGNSNISLDTETTGLNPYLGDSLFGIAISTKDDDYYFNFNGLSDDRNAVPLPSYVLPRELIIDLVQNYPGTIFMHNAKFDLSFLEKEGLSIDSLNIHCTFVVARVLYNNRDSYSLDSVGSDLGYRKDDSVKKYISTNKLYRWSNNPGQKKRTKIPYYILVPLATIAQYAQLDSKIALKIGIKQLSIMSPEEVELCKIENQLAKALIRMEKTGVLVCNEYTEKMHKIYTNKLRLLKIKFKELTGYDDVEKRKNLIEAFTTAGYKLPSTEKGNPRLNDESLESLDGELPTVVREFRKVQKKLATYFTNYLHLQDKDALIHTSFNPAKTKTGRFSSSKPNLQNIHKEDSDTACPVRRCFIPREGYVFFMFDYDQMEYRLMLDYAGESELIEQIGKGLDVHTATADLVGITRNDAKTLNFMLLYGGGVDKLANSLNVSIPEAKKIKAKYFKKLPNVKKFIKKVIKVSEDRGWIKNCCGRKYWFSQDYYKAPNYLIQGGCADIIKLAMVNVDKLLMDKKSRLLLTVHDELIFEMDKDEMYLIPKIKEIMESAYSHRFIPLTTGIEWSDMSWHDKIVWEDK